jgi:hypothetical protein
MSIYTKIKNRLGSKLSKEADERDERLVPLAQDVIRIIGNMRPALGNIEHETIVKSYFPITTQILEVLRKANVTLKDANYVMQLALQAYDQTNKLVIDSLQKSFEKAENKVWGMESEDITMQYVDSILRYQGEPTFDQSILRTDSELEESSENQS